MENPVGMTLALKKALEEKEKKRRLDFCYLSISQKYTTYLKKKLSLKRGSGLF